MKQEFVFCVDSDGCVMDTMTYKHKLFFGPVAADIFEVTNREIFLAEWNRVNLYSKTRGVNRFVGLLMGLEFAGKKEITHFKKWVETTNSLSNDSLKAAIDKKPSEDLKKALEWSNEVNRKIKAYEGDALAFDGALDCLKRLHELGKVYVVSSANKEAVQEEWIEQGLMTHVDDLFCQDRGKKEDVIASIIQSGHHSKCIMMIGDSPGDLYAAEQNDIAFYPILVNQEKKSWQMLCEEIADRFVAGKLDDDEQNGLKTVFWNNLEA